jgi:hypothetical protein
VASTILTPLLNSSALLANAGQYRPPQWANPPMVSVTVPAANSGVSLTAGTSQENAGTAITDTNILQAGSIINTTSAPTTYVFDAVLDLEHEQRLEKTHHPIQTGADVSSHAYLMPGRVVLNVLMSDTVASFTPGNFTGSPSKSVSAYQTMLNIQATRMPLTVTTRLRTYTSMVIAGISPREDYKTITGLRMRVEFEQIFTASTSTVANSARPDDTNSTGLGTVSPTPVPTATTPAAVPTMTAAGTTPPMSDANFANAGALSDGLGTATGGSSSSLTTQFGFPQATSASSTVNVPGASNISSSPGQQSIPGQV